MIPYVYSETALLNVMTAVVTGVASALGTSPGGKPGRVVTTFGQIAWDTVDCGQLALTVNRVYRSQGPFPTDGTDRQIGNCATGLIIGDFSMSMIRCVGGEGANASPPTPARMLKDLTIALADEYILRQTTQCILNALLNPTPGNLAYIANFIVNDAPAQGPQGNAGGFQLNFKVGWALQLDCGC